MPIYDYRCKACGHSFDALQKVGAEPLRDCPECGAPALQQLMSAPAFHLKGKGWRKSDDTPKKPDVRPRFMHTFDSPTPHAEHAHHPAPAAKSAAGHSHDSHGHDHGSHSHGDSGGHSHKHGSKDAAKSGHSHGHSHSHGHGHSHSGGHKHD